MEKLYDVRICQLSMCACAPRCGFAHPICLASHPRANLLRRTQLVSKNGSTGFEL